MLSSVWVVTSIYSVLQLSQEQNQAVKSLYTVCLVPTTIHTTDAVATKLGMTLGSGGEVPLDHVGGGFPPHHYRVSSWFFLKFFGAVL